MSKYDVVIAIDPDVDKSGVAFLEVATKTLEVSALTFANLLDYLQFVKRESVTASSQRFVVVVEAGWLNSAHWHVRDGDSRRIAAAKGNSAGRNHEVGRKILELCRHYGLDTVEQRPLKKMWNGRDGKITHEELASFTGLMGATNQEQRDAALLAWVYAGLPVRIAKEKMIRKTAVSRKIHKY
ncbi:MAG: hypothetical protein LBG96_16690 [Tannerella sp.]|jgi:hypothetical protein|nr:hypothetical protein [Tannerella sp.]